MADMSPLAFMKLYRDMVVPFIGGEGHAQVSVREYRNNGAAYREGADDLPQPFRPGSRAEKSTYLGLRAFSRLKPAVERLGDTHGRSAGPNRYDFTALQQPYTPASPGSAVGTAITTFCPPLEYDGIVTVVRRGHGGIALNRVFAGKGSPRATRQVLQLLKLLRLVPDPGDNAALQTYCDQCLGLDCNGFVQNYLAEIGWIDSDFADLGTKSANSWAPANRRRQHLGDVVPRDVLVKSDGGHVSIIDDDSFSGVVSLGSEQVLRCHVVESCGTAHHADGRDGLMCTEYVIRELRDYQFQADRGLTTRTDRYRVYIAHALGRP